MPTNRTRRSRNRRPMRDPEIEQFFTSGTYQYESDRGIDFFIGDPSIYELWHLHKVHFKNTAAWKIFEEGQGNFSMSTRLSHAGYLKWKNQHGL
ncbi:MAG: hypothetical protein A4E65_03613 [Syntrophorhabdus sp. PtaU1.Bin153]|nr:MAG: hypothetical protein A4E65_03613 [Syntrophorhabdus sp. PtaU1.Bin153]